MEDKKFKWTLTKVFSLVSALLIAFILLFRQNEPIYYLVSNIGGLVFLMYLSLKEGEWI